LLVLKEIVTLGIIGGKNHQEIAEIKIPMNVLRIKKSKATSIMVGSYWL